MLTYPIVFFIAGKLRFYILIGTQEADILYEIMSPETLQCLWWLVGIMFKRA